MNLKVKKELHGQIITAETVESEWSRVGGGHTQPLIDPSCHWYIFSHIHRVLTFLFKQRKMKQFGREFIKVYSFLQERTNQPTLKKYATNYSR